MSALKDGEIECFAREPFEDGLLSRSSGGWVCLSCSPVGWIALVGVQLAVWHRVGWHGNGLVFIVPVRLSRAQFSNWPQNWGNLQFRKGRSWNGRKVGENHRRCGVAR